MRLTCGYATDATDRRDGQDNQRRSNSKNEHPKTVNCDYYTHTVLYITEQSL